MVWKPDYATLGELRNYVTRSSETVDDAELALALTDASRAVDHATQRQFGQVTTVQQRRYTAVWSRRRCRWVVKIDDLQDVTGLIIQIAAVAVASFELEPINALQEGRPYQRLVINLDEPNQPTGEEHEIFATALWGWAAVPDTIKQATLMQGNRFYNRRTSPYGIAGSPDTGSELRLLARADPDVALSVRPYERDPVVFA